MFDTHWYGSKKESKSEIEVPVNEFNPFDFESSLEKAINYHIGWRNKWK